MEKFFFVIQIIIFWTSFVYCEQNQSQYQQQQQNSLNYYIACTEQVKNDPQIQYKFEFQASMVMFTLDKNQCQLLDAQDKRQISIFFVNFNQEQECAIKVLNINTQECQQDYDVFIAGLNLQQEKEDKKVVISPDLINLQPGINLEIQNVEIQQYLGPMIKILNVQSIKMVNCTIQNGFSSDRSLFDLVDIDNLIIENSSFGFENNSIVENNDQQLYRKSSGDSVIFGRNIKEIVIKKVNVSDIYSESYSAFIQVDGGNNVIINDTSIYNSVGYEGGGISVQNYQTAELQYSSFQNNSALMGSGGIRIEKTDEIWISDCSFLGNKALEDGGAVEIQQKSELIIIENSIFQNNQAKSAGGIKIYNNNNLIMRNSVFEGNIAFKHGGGLFILVSLNLLMENSQFKENTCVKGYGGGVNIAYSGEEGGRIKIQMNDSLFKKNEASSGGGLYLQDVKFKEESYLNKVIFRENSGLQNFGGGLALEKVFGFFEIKNCEFYKNFAEYSGGGISAKVLVNVVIEKCYFEENHSGSSSGGIFLRNGSNLKVVDNVFVRQTSQGLGSGMFAVFTTDSVFQRLNFISGESSGQTGGLGILISSGIEILDCRFQENISLRGTALRLENTRNIKVKNAIFVKNYASNNSGGAFIEKSSNVLLQDCVFDQNKGEIHTGALRLMFASNVLVKNCNFTQNKGMDSRGAVSLISSDDIEFLNCSFDGNWGHNQAGGILAQLSYQLIIKQTNFTNNVNYGKLGGGISIDGVVGVQIEDCLFFENSSQDSGGAINLFKTKDFNISRSTFKENLAEQQGGAVYAQNCYNFSLQEVQISQNIADLNGGGVWMDSVKKIGIVALSVVKNSGKGRQAGGIGFVNNCSDISLSQSSFMENSINGNGGGIYSQESLNVHIQETVFEQNGCEGQGCGVYAGNGNSFQILKSDFEKHRSGQQGGSIYMDNIEEIEIYYTRFIDNFALMKGGALFFQNIKQISLIKSKFLGNLVGNEVEFGSKGGAIYVENSEIVLFQKGEFKNSYAYMQGGSLYIDSVQKVEIQESNFLNNTVNFNKDLQIRNKNSSYILSQGGCVYFKPKVLDRNGQPSLLIQNSQFYNCQASSGGGLLIDQKPNQKLVKIEFQKLKFENNLADFGPSVRFLGFLKENLNLLEENNVQNQDNKGFIEKDDYFYGYYYNEQRISSDSSSFKLCQKGYYMEKGGEFSCRECLKNGVCEGGYIPVYPEENYWRDSNSSYQFYYCENNPEACLGRDLCREGHTGLLCENCDLTNNYSIDSSSDSCKKCDQNAIMIVFRLILIFFLIVFFLFNQIYGINSRINKQLLYRSLNIIFDFPMMKVKLLSAATKIFIMHFQMIYIVLGDQMKQIEVFFSQFNMISNPQSGFSRNLECLIVRENDEDIEQMGYYISLYGMIILGGTVLFLLTIELLCYFFKKYIKDYAQLIEYIEGTILVFCLFVQPSVVLNGLKYLKSRNINGKEYCFANTFIEIDSDYYKKKVLPMNLGLVLVLGIIFPAVLTVYILYGKSRNILKKTSFQRRFGVLYLEYKNKHFYWDILMMVLKMLIVLISNFMYEQSQEKGVLVMLIFIGYMIFCYQIKPYQTEILNNQAIYSSGLQIFTIGCLTNKSIENISSGVKYTVFVAVLIMNVMFILYSAYIMILDFNLLIRCKLIQYFQFSQTIQKYIRKQSGREQKALMKWKKIKRTLWFSIYNIRNQAKKGSFSSVFKEYYLRCKDTPINQIQQQLKLKSRYQGKSKENLSEIEENELYDSQGNYMFNNEDYGAGNNSSKLSKTQILFSSEQILKNGKNLSFYLDESSDINSKNTDLNTNSNSNSNIKCKSLKLYDKSGFFKQESNENTQKIPSTIDFDSTPRCGSLFSTVKTYRSFCKSNRGDVSIDNIDLQQ